MEHLPTVVMEGGGGSLLQVPMPSPWLPSGEAVPPAVRSERLQGAVSLDYRSDKGSFLVTHTNPSADAIQALRPRDSVRAARYNEQERLQLLYLNTIHPDSEVTKGRNERVLAKAKVAQELSEMQPRKSVIAMPPPTPPVAKAVAPARQRPDSMRGGSLRLRNGSLRMRTMASVLSPRTAAACSAPERVDTSLEERRQYSQQLHDDIAAMEDGMPSAFDAARFSRCAQPCLQSII